MPTRGEYPPTPPTTPPTERGEENALKAALNERREAMLIAEEKLKKANKGFFLGTGKNSAEVAISEEEYNNAKNEYEVAKAEYAAEAVGQVVTERRELADARLKKHAENAGVLGVVEKGWDKIKAGYKWLGDQNLEKLGWKPENRAGKFLARLGSVRTAINGTLLGLGFMGGGWAAAIGILGTRKAMQFIGTSGLTYDVLKNRSIAKEEASGLLQEVTVEQVKVLSDEEIGQRLSAIEVRSRLDGKTVADSKYANSYQLYIEVIQERVREKEATERAEAATAYVQEQLAKAQESYEKMMKKDSRKKKTHVALGVAAGLFVSSGLFAEGVRKGWGLAKDVGNTTWKMISEKIGLVANSAYNAKKEVDTTAAASGLESANLSTGSLDKLTSNEAAPTDSMLREAETDDSVIPGDIETDDNLKPVSLPATQEIANHVVPKNGSFLGGARQLEKILTPENIQAIRDIHPDWPKKWSDTTILRQWRLEQAQNFGQGFDKHAEYFNKRLHPGAEMRLMVDPETKVPSIVVGEKNVENLGETLVKPRIVNVPPQVGTPEIYPGEESEPEWSAADSDEANQLLKKIQESDPKFAFAQATGASPDSVANLFAEAAAGNPDANRIINSFEESHEAGKTVGVDTSPELGALGDVVDHDYAPSGTNPASETLPESATPEPHADVPEKSPELAEYIPASERIGMIGNGVREIMVEGVQYYAKVVLFEDGKAAHFVYDTGGKLAGFVGSDGLFHEGPPKSGWPVGLPETTPVPKSAEVVLPPEEKPVLGENKPEVPTPEPEAQVLNLGGKAVKFFTNEDGRITGYDFVDERRVSKFGAYKTVLDTHNVKPEQVIHAPQNEHKVRIIEKTMYLLQQMGRQGFVGPEKEFLQLQARVTMERIAKNLGISVYEAFNDETLHRAGFKVDHHGIPDAPVQPVSPSPVESSPLPSAQDSEVLDDLPEETRFLEYVARGDFHKALPDVDLSPEEQVRLKATVNEFDSRLAAARGNRELELQVRQEILSLIRKLRAM